MKQHHFLLVVLAQHNNDFM